MSRPRSALSSRHRKTLEAILARPTRSNIKWREIEALLVSLGAAVSEGNGSRVRVFLNNRVATFHRPHPQPETDKGAVDSVREFLIHAGVGQ